MNCKQIGMLFLIMMFIVSMLVGCGATNKEEVTIEAGETVETKESDEIVKENIKLEEATTEEAEEETPGKVLEETEKIEETVTEKPASETVEEVTTEEPVAVEPIEKPITQYTYTDMTKTMYAKSTVNVRDLPDTSGNKLGGLNQNDEVAVTGQCNETGWYRFEYNGVVAYVSNTYLVDEKIETTTQAESSATTTTAFPYEFWTWYDRGTYFVLYAPSYEELKQHYWSGSGWSVTGDHDMQQKLQERYAGTNRTFSVIYGATGKYGVFAHVVDSCERSAEGLPIYYPDGAQLEFK